jgi:hypothetical protein
MANKKSDTTGPCKGDTYVCSECGMAFVVYVSCGCSEPCTVFQCCGMDMQKQ